MLALLVTLFLSLFYIGTSTVSAHPAPNSVLTLTIQKGGSVTAETRVPFSELNVALGRQTTDYTITESVNTYIQSRLKLSSQGRLWTNTFSSATAAGNYLVARFDFDPPDWNIYKTATLDYKIVVDKVTQHNVLVYVNQATGASFQAGVIGHGNSSNLLNTLDISLTGGHINSFGSSLILGVNHLRHGYDHILFLLSLILIAPFFARKKKWHRSNNLRKTLIHIFFLSLAFTIGHSLSLLVGSFLSIASIEQYIEILIVITIMLSAAHAARPIFEKAELLIVLCFGLVHGLAFSSQLFSANLTLSERLLTTFSFNLGLELFQLAILVVAIPTYLLILHFDRLDKARETLAFCAFLIADFWLIVRVQSLF